MAKSIPFGVYVFFKYIDVYKFFKIIIKSFKRLIYSLIK